MTNFHRAWPGLGGSNVDLAEEAVNQILAKTAFKAKANANVIRTASNDRYHPRYQDLSRRG
jgi:flagellar basal body rod protein FlgG